MQRIVGIILPFIVRTVLIYSLSASYAGLSGLFASVLSVLSLAELGISNAIVYSMYKPVSEGDEGKVCALLNVYRKAYRIIGSVIVALGLFLMPFLKYLIHGSVPDDVNIYLLFCIYLFNTVISYFLYGYKSCILSVNQRQDVISKISIITRMLLQVLQCTLLLSFRSYYLVFAERMISIHKKPINMGNLLSPKSISGKIDAWFFDSRRQLSCI